MSDSLARAIIANDASDFLLAKNRCQNSAEVHNKKIV